MCGCCWDLVKKEFLFHQLELSLDGCNLEIMEDISKKVFISPLLSMF